MDFLGFFVTSGLFLALFSCWLRVRTFFDFCTYQPRNSLGCFVVEQEFLEAVLKEQDGTRNKEMVQFAELAKFFVENCEEISYSNLMKVQQVKRDNPRIACKIPPPFMHKETKLSTPYLNGIKDEIYKEFEYRLWLSIFSNPFGFWSYAKANIVEIQKRGGVGTDILLLYPIQDFLSIKIFKEKGVWD